MRLVDVGDVTNAPSVLIRNAMYLIELLRLVLAVEVGVGGVCRADSNSVSYSNK